jgi:hypothetical protein
MSGILIRQNEPCDILGRDRLMSIKPDAEINNTAD